jgi:hypothetical protein
MIATLRHNSIYALLSTKRYMPHLSLPHTFLLQLDQLAHPSHHVTRYLAHRPFLFGPSPEPRPRFPNPEHQVPARTLYIEVYLVHPTHSARDKDKKCVDHDHVLLIHFKQDQLKYPKGQ